MKTFVLEPHKFNIWLDYICPECGYLHQVDPAQVEFPGGVTCDCGSKLIWRVFSELKVSPVWSTKHKTYTGSTPVILLREEEDDNNAVVVNTLKEAMGEYGTFVPGQPNPSSKPITTSEADNCGQLIRKPQKRKILASTTLSIDDILRSLKKIGYRESDARRLIEQRLQIRDYENDEELVKDILLGR